MSDNPQTAAAQKLIQAFSTISSTEDLIVFVAGTDYMLSFCQELIEQYDYDSSGPLPVEINALCASHGILPGLLYSEIRKVLIALNRFHNASRDHYATLGLPENAPTEEIKKAYRQLSKKYHPDMLQDGQQDSQQRFMEISGAYHALMSRQNDTASKDGKPWRKKRVRRKATQRSKVGGLFLTLIPLAFILIGVSIFVSRQYDEQVYLGQLETSSQLATDATAALQNVNVTAPFEKTNTSVPLPKKEIPATADVPITDPITSDSTSAIADSSNASVGPIRQAGEDSSSLVKEPEVPKTIQQTTPVTIAQKSDHQIVPPPHPERVKASSIEQESSQAVSSSATQEVEAIQKQEQPAQASSGNTLAQNTVKAESDKTEPQLSQSSQANKAREQKSKSAEEQVLAKQKEKKNLLKKVEEILVQYTASYNTKDMDQLLTLFHPDATENGQLQSRLTDQYKSLFSETKSIQLSLGAVLWNEFDNGLEAKCSFTAFYKYKNGRKMDYIGDITFYITDEKGEHKIKALNYVFIN